MDVFGVWSRTPSGGGSLEFESARVRGVRSRWWTGGSAGWGKRARRLAKLWGKNSVAISGVWSTIWTVIIVENCTVVVVCQPATVQLSFG